MASLTTQPPVNLDNEFDHTNVEIYGSKKAILYGIRGKFTGKDSDKKEIEPSGTGKNEGKFLLKDIRKCPKVQKWIESSGIEGEKEVKKVNAFSSKTAKAAFDKLGITVEEYKAQGGKASGKRTKGSITCKDIKEFQKSNGAPAVVTDDKKFTTKKMMERIEKLGNRTKEAAKEYLSNNPGSYKSGKVWGKKEVDAAIEYAMSL